MVRFFVVLFIGCIALGSLLRRRSGEETVRWSGAAPAGWVHLRNVNGSITVENSTSDRVEVLAKKRWQGSRDAVRFVSNESGGELYLCALYGPGGS